MHWAPLGSPSAATPVAAAATPPQRRPPPRLWAAAAARARLPGRALRPGPPGMGTGGTW